MLKEYDRFEPTIAKLRAELTDPATRKDHPGFLGNGLVAMAFLITEDDASYVVRIPSGDVPSPAVIDEHLAGAVLGNGIPHLEHIIAASYKDGVTVAEVMPGKEVSALTPDEIKGITDEQLGTLVDTLTAASEHGIEIDPKPSNVFYDPMEGFGLIDYHSSKVAGRGTRDQDLGMISGWMATSIANAGFYGKPFRSERTAADYAHDLQFKKAHLDVMQRYRLVVERKLSGEDQRAALKEIGALVRSTQETVANYSDSVWVNERIAEDDKLRRRRQEWASKQAASGSTTLDVM
jgi:hypothetical protein